MYISIGENNIINVRNIIGIFDLDRLTVYKSNRKYLSSCEKNGIIKNMTENLPKSFILYFNNINNKNSINIYLSCLNTGTIFKKLRKIKK